MAVHLRIDSPSSVSVKHENPDLDGKVAVVTGGSRGIGRAIAEAFARAGADVVPTSRTREDVEAVVESIREAGGESTTVTTDVADSDQVADLFDAVEDEFGRLDVLVNNAGINPDRALGRPEDVEVEAFDDVVEVNLRSAFDCAREASDLLHADGGGSVINVASISGLVGTPRQHPYTATKHGLVGITKSLALDWAPNVRVNAIAAGFVETDLTEPVMDNESLYESMVDQIPMDRFGDPAEIGGTALFLASDMSTYLTGASIVADGGWTAH